jgi:hypothetical protein
MPGEDAQASQDLYVEAKEESKIFDPAEFGFEFSTADFEDYMERRGAHARSRQGLPAPA